MSRYRRRPQEVAAVQYDGTNADAVVQLLGGDANARAEVTRLPGPGRGMTPGIRVHTFARRDQVRVGDWVAVTEQSFKVIPAEQFAAEYEEITD